jgi:4-aminobutyrate aminotransferase
MHPAAESLYARDRVIVGVDKLRFSWLMEAGGRRLLDLSGW